VLAFSYIDRVVVNGRVAHRTGHIDAPRVIVLADVVAHNRAHVSCVLFGIKAAFVAVQEEAAVIIVAIVVLDEGVARVPVGIETFNDQNAGSASESNNSIAVPNFGNYTHLMTNPRVMQFALRYEF